MSEAAAPPTATSSSETSFGRTLGASPEMRRVYVLATRLAAAAVPVVIEGETGTGKEVLAESIHEASPRAGGPFVVKECSAREGREAEDELLASVDQAEGGTLLLDEIAELPLSLQARLLRALEHAAGAGGARDVRVIVTTRRDLDREVQHGRLREDLSQHLSVARIELPPLRRRRGDIEFLARHFVRKLGGDAALLTAAQLARWQDYSWPGNIRELQSAVSRLVTLGELAPPAAAAAMEVDETSSLVRFIERALAEDLPLAPARQRMIDAFDRIYVEKILKKHNGSVIRAASDAGVARRYFQVLKARQR